MNKFIILLVAAVAACAIVAPAVSSAPAADEFDEINDEPSEMALFENDERETAQLSGPNEVFNDFCLSSRDEVRAYLRQQVNNKALKAFNLVSDVLTLISSEISEASNQEINKGKELVAEDALNTKQAVQNVASRVKDVVKESASTTIGRAQDQFNVDNLKQLAIDACDNITNTLRPQIEKSFNNYKNELVASGADVAAVRFNKVGCLTSGRLNKMASLCNIVRSMGPMIQDMF